MALWWAIPAALQVTGTIINTSSARKQNQNQLALNQYNASMQYRVSMDNIDSGLAIAKVNAAMGAAAAQMQFGIAGMQTKVGEMQANIIRRTADMNVGIIRETMAYNDSLKEEELSLMWDALDLDLLHLENQRAVERGEIEAAQSASGTVMGQDSNAAVIIDQKTQEALDATIVRHQADIAAARIMNERAQSLWQGTAEIMKTAWEGEMGAIMAQQNANLQSASTYASGASQLLQSQASLISANIGAGAARKSAGYQYQAGQFGAQTQYSQNQSQINSNFVSGMFSAASSLVGGYYMGKQPSMNLGGLSGSAPAATQKYLPLSAPQFTSHAFKSGYQANVSLANPGTSLLF